jgi:hypothetical protein
MNIKNKKMLSLGFALLMAVPAFAGSVPPFIKIGEIYYITLSGNFCRSDEKFVVAEIKDIAKEGWILCRSRWSQIDYSVWINVDGIVSIINTNDLKK